MRIGRLVISLVLLAAALVGPVSAQSPALTFTLETTNPDGKSLVPRLTWSTTPAAGSCAAAGSWSGAKLAAGTEVLAAVTSAKSYALTCTWPGSKTATVKITPPTTNTDGSSLTDLGGFKILYGTDAASLNQVVNLTGAASTSWTSPTLAVGQWYFAAQAVTQSGIESARSNVATKTIAADVSVTRTQVLAFTIPNPPVVSVE